MGLDAVEIVMSIEERFGVTISDAEAEQCVTPAILIDLVLGKLSTTEKGVCITQRAFYSLRRVAVRELGMARRAVQLDSDICSLVPVKQHKLFWETLRDGTQAKMWPELQRPAWLVWGLFTGTMVVLSPVIFSRQWIMILPAGLIFLFVGERLTRRFKQIIPASHSNFRALVPNVATFESGFWLRQEVAENIKQIVIEQLGLKDGRYREDARFVEDLGVG
jgi:acyl carrier protein